VIEVAALLELLGVPRSESLERCLAVSLPGAMLLRLDDDDPVGTDAPVAGREQTLLDVVRQ